MVLLTVLTALALNTPLMAQASIHDNRNELSVNYGYLSTTMAIPVLADIFATVLSFGAAKPDNTRSTGAIGIEYFRYNQSGRFAYGAAASFELVRTDMYDKDNKFVGEQRFSMATLMPACKLSWFNKEHVSMYTKLAAGIGFLPDSDGTPVCFAAQFNPVCLEAGNSRLRGFMELGWGMQGLVMGGIRYGF